MAISYDSVLASVPFKFLVGPDKKEYTVHAALVAQHSKPLDILMNGKMAEAKEGCAVLDDVDEDTFVRFGQYVYTGDYGAAETDNSQAPSTNLSTNYASRKPSNTNVAETTRTYWGEIEQDPGFEADLAEELGIFKDNHPGSSPLKKNKKYAGNKQAALWDKFKTKTYAITKPTVQPRGHHESREDHAETFLCHARLYVFADRYDVTPLRDLSLSKLHRALVKFIWYDKRCGDIVELLRYSYSNTADHPESTDDLRQLIIHYCACVVEDLSKSDQFQLLLEEDGSLARDLVKQMLQRLD